MEEARAVLARLERIEALEREGAGVPLLLAELRELVREASVWAERERDPAALGAAAALAEARDARVTAGCGHETVPAPEVSSRALRGVHEARVRCRVRDPTRSSDSARHSPRR